jgi:hypothetical protein
MILELIRAVGVPVGLLLFAGGVLLYRRIYRFQRRPPDKVIQYLRPVSLSELGDLLSPGAEHFLRENATREQFFREQQHRFWLALEYLRRMAHNALVMVEWAYYELRRTHRTRSEEDRELCLDLASSAVQVRMCSFVLRLRINIWLVRMALLPFLPPPRVENLVNVGSTDLLEFYEKMRSTAIQLSQAYGDDYHEKMVEALRVEAVG